MTLARETLPTQFLNQKNRTREDSNKSVEDTVNRFHSRFAGDSKDSTPEARKTDATVLTNEYYDLVTDFYEFGWGQAFHFATRYKGEGFYESLARHEFYLALRAGFKANMKIIDVGSGVGGPLRNMARFTGAHVTGINNNGYQVGRARRYDAKLGLSERCDHVKADFNHIPMADSSVDGAYEIEATCHASDRTACYSEILRVLKPGAYFVGYEWATTDKFDGQNDRHRQIALGIELGNGLPPLENMHAVDSHLRAAGFIVEDAFDAIERTSQSLAKQHSWYEPLEGNYTSLFGLKSTPLGRWTTMKAMGVMETIRVVPKGSQKTARVLEEGAVNLVEGGRLGIFTPSYFFLARKPREGEVVARK